MTQTPVIASNLQRWPVADLVPYTKNARTHSPEQVGQIAASIHEFGFTNPILVAEDGEIIAGHGRLLAAETLGMAEVPVIVLGHMTAAQRRAYVIADNQLALNAGWDSELLQQELAALSMADFDLSLLGFGEEQLAALLDPEGIDDLAEDEDDSYERGVPLAIILEPQEMKIWKDAKKKLGLARDKVALLKLATTSLEADGNED